MWGLICLTLSRQPPSQLSLGHPAGQTLLWEVGMPLPSLQFPAQGIRSLPVTKLLETPALIPLSTPQARGQASRSSKCSQEVHISLKLKWCLQKWSLREMRITPPTMSHLHIPIYLDQVLPDAATQEPGGFIKEQNTHRGLRVYGGQSRQW